MIELVSKVNEQDFRPYICETSQIKNIAFVAKGESVNVDIDYEAKLMICLWG